MNIAQKLMGRFQTPMPESCKPDFIGKEPTFNMDGVEQATFDKFQDQLAKQADPEDREGDKIDIILVGIESDFPGALQMLDAETRELICETVMTDPNGKPLVAVGEELLCKGCNMQPAKDLYEEPRTSYSIGCRSIDVENSNDEQG